MGRELRRSLLNATVAISVVNEITDLDVHPALVAPGGAPRVAHDPVVDTRDRVCAPANNVGGMVEPRSAIRVVEDAATVELESKLVSLNQHRKNADAELLLHD